MKRTMTVKENYEFRRIYAKGRSGVSPYLVVYVRPNRRGRNRIGVTVSTKLGHAVVRNRVRRRLREIFRLNQGGQGVAPQPDPPPYPRGVPPPRGGDPPGL